MQLLTGQEAGLKGNKRRAFFKAKAECNKKLRSMKRKSVQGPENRVATKTARQSTTIKQSSNQKCKNIPKTGDCRHDPRNLEERTWRRHHTQ